MKKNWPFSFYFLYFGAFATLLPFFVIFYQRLGFDGTQIGLLTGMAPLIILVGAPLGTGLADYNMVRVAYVLPHITSFNQITSDPAVQSSLASTYGSVDNIDLWIGGLAEDHLPNSSMGATFTAILVDQFTPLRDGDRFWYQASLSQHLLQDIQETSLADIIRRNTKLTKLQADVFFFKEGTTEIIDSAIVTTQESDSQNEQLGEDDQQDNDRPQRPPPPQRGPGGRGNRRGGLGGRGGN